MIEFVLIYLLIGLSVATTVSLRLQYEKFQQQFIGFEVPDVTVLYFIICVLAWPRTIFSMVDAIVQLKAAIKRQDAYDAETEEADTISADQAMEWIESQLADAFTGRRLPKQYERYSTLEEFDAGVDCAYMLRDIAQKCGTQFYYLDNPPAVQVGDKSYNEAQKKFIVVDSIKTTRIQRFLVQDESAEACQNCCEVNVSAPYWTMHIKPAKQGLIWLEGQTMNTHVYTVHFEGETYKFECGEAWFFTHDIGDEETFL